MLALAWAAPPATAQGEQPDRSHQAYSEVFWTARAFDGFNGFLVEGPFDRPSSLAYDPGSRELLLLDIDQDRIGIFSRGLVQKFSFGSWEVLPSSREIEVGEDGRIYALFAQVDAVRVFNYRGEWLRDLVVPPIDGAPGLSSLDWTPDGLLLVGESTSGRLLALDKDTGERVWDMGTRGYGAGRFGGIAGAAYSPDGAYLYVLDPTTPPTEDLRDRAHVVQVFDAKTRRHLFGWGAHGIAREDFSSPDSLAVAPCGLVLVSDALRHVVKAFDSEGNFVMMIGGVGPEAGALYFPTGLAVDEFNVLYVAEEANRRVQAFQLYADERRRISLVQPAGRVKALRGNSTQEIGYNAARERDPDRRPRR